MKKIWAPWRMEYIIQDKSAECIFCSLPKAEDDKNNFILSPYRSIVLTPGISNSNKISNEDSSNNSFSIVNNNDLNRYSGSDKLDNSKRINYGIKINNNKISLELFQNYEFTFSCCNL